MKARIACRGGTAMNASYDGDTASASTSPAIGKNPISSPAIKILNRRRSRASARRAFHKPNGSAGIARLNKMIQNQLSPRAHAIALIAEYSGPRANSASALAVKHATPAIVATTMKTRSKPWPRSKWRSRGNRVTSCHRNSGRNASG